MHGFSIVAFSDNRPENPCTGGGIVSHIVGQALCHITKSS